jgi:hypothetical protein
MPRLPQKLSDTGYQATLINQIIDYLAAITPIGSATVKHKMTPFGVLTEANHQRKSTASSGMVYRGVWSVGTYAENDVVIIQSGAAAGTYISMTGGNTNDPATGVNWIQIAPGNTVGNWT